MGLLENLVEGFSRAAGADDSVNAIEKQKTDRRATQQEEVHGKSKMIFDDVQRLMDRKATLDPNSPTYQKDVGDINASLEAHQQAFTDLYHPEKNPGALQHFGSFLKSHLGGKKTPQIPKTPGEAKMTMAQLQSSAAGPGQAAPPEFPGLSPQESDKARRVKYGLEPRAAAEKPEKYQGQLTTTTDAQGVQHYWRVPLEPGAPPEEVDFQGQKVQPKSAGKDKYAWTRKNGKIVSVKLDANNQIIPGTENANILPPASMTGRISTSNYHYVDEKGQIHQLQETRTSTPMGGGASPVVPKTPGEAKDRANAVAPKDTVIAFKGSKDYIDTKSSYEAAVDRTAIMEKNLKNALAGDQQAMLSLVANHIGMTLGAQKGARITRAVWDEAVASTPWFQKIAAKFSSDGYLSGVTLAPEQMQQMVRLAHEKTQTLKDHLGRLDKERGASGGGKKGKVSLAKAKALPENQGKTDEQVKQHIQELGYEVTP